MKKIFISTENNKAGLSGATLIEAMVAMLVLLLLFLAGAAFMLNSSARIDMQRNRRAAFEVANARIESLRTAGFDAIKPPTDYDIHYLEDQGGGSWGPKPTTDPGETININGLNLPISTRVQYIDEDPSDGLSAYDYLWTEVSVGYRMNPDERIVLHTYIGQYR